MADFVARALSRLPWVKRKAAKLSHRNALLRLKALGFAPATIYDIGAYRGGWTRLAGEVFPEAAFVLFEANADNAAHLSPLRHFTVALSAEDGEKSLFLPREGDATGTSLYRENSAHYDAQQPRRPQGRDVAPRHAGRGRAAPARRPHQDRRPGRRARRHRRRQDRALPLRGADRRAIARELQQGRAADRRDPAGDHPARLPLRRYLRAAPRWRRQRAAGGFFVREADAVRGDGQGVGAWCAVGWAKRSVPTSSLPHVIAWARREDEPSPTLRAMRWLALNRLPTPPAPDARPPSRRR